MCIMCGCAYCDAQVAAPMDAQDAGATGVDTLGAPTGQAYTLTNTKWGTDALGTASGEITWSADLSGLAFDALRFVALTLEDFEQALRDAFAAWERVAQISFREVATLQEADVTLSVTAEDVAGFNFGTPYGVVGLASWSYANGPVSNGLGVTQSGQIYFDAAENWVPSGDAFGTVSFLSVATHEIGHILGLGHYDGSGQVMNSYATTDLLQAGDITGIQTIYGARETGSNAAELRDLALGLAGAVFNARGGDDVVLGSAGADQISGGRGDDDLSGGAGDDMLVDTSGTNSLAGEADDDTLIGGLGVLQADGGAGNDWLLGGIGADTLIGGAGDDVLRGDPLGGTLFGNDHLIAGAGTDQLSGGGGADVFIFAPGEGANTIARFESLESGAAPVAADFEIGIDTIDLSAFGLADFTAVGTAMAMTENGVFFAAGATSILLYGIALEDLSEDDFVL